MDIIVANGSLCDVFSFLLNFFLKWSLFRGLSCFNDIGDNPLFITRSVVQEK
jgi:hypothetical protein